MNIAIGKFRADSLSLSGLADELEKVRRLPDNAMLTPEQAAEMMARYGIPIKTATLARWRCVRSDGPAFRKIGGRVTYLAGAIRQFLGATA